MEGTEVQITQGHHRAWAWPAPLRLVACHGLLVFPELQFTRLMGLTIPATPVQR